MTGSAMSEFLPSYARKNSQVLKKSENRWTRLSEKENKLSVEEEITAELYRTVVAILNKLTPQKFKTLIVQFLQLRIDTPERLEGAVERIFEKAIREPMYNYAYANMCRCLLQIKVSGPDDKDVTFMKHLLGRCQKEFEKAQVEQETQLEGLSEEEKKMKREEMKEEASKNKRRMLGNIKFIGELFKLKLLTDKIMHDCIVKLLRAGDEESLESMCELLFTIGKDLDSDRAKPRMEQYFDYINKIISGKKTSLKVSFMLRDVVDLRKNNWVPRHEIYNPKTIDQIHKEAHEIQRLHKKGGRRDSPKLMQLSNDRWMVSRRGGKPLSIDTNKLKNISKRANADDKISLGPSGRSLEPSRRSLGGLSQSGRGSTGGLGKSGSTSNEQEVPANRSSSAGARTGGKRQSTSNVKGKADTTMIKGIKDKIRPSLTTEEMTKNTKAIIDMFVNIEDMGAALGCFTYFKSPEIHHVFVSTAVEHTYEFDSTARQLTGRLFNELLLQRKLAKEQFSLGLGKALKFAEDSATNYPKLWCYLAEIITPVIVGNQFKLADLKPLILHLVECKKAGVVLAEILTMIAKESSPANAKLFWTNSNISCLDVLAKDMPHREFLQQKNLTFFPSDIDEINKLLHQEVIVNDTVNACIDRATAVEDMNSLEPLSAFSPGGCGTTGGWGNSGSAFHEQKVVASRSSAGARTGDKGQVRSDCHSAVEVVKFSTKPAQMKTEVVQSTYNVQEKVESTMTKEIRDKIRPSLTTEEMTKKTKAIIDMFVNIEDMGAALSCFTYFKSPEIHHVFVSTAVEHTYELDSTARQLTGRLFNELLLQRKLAKEQFSLGLGKALKFAEDSAINYTKLWCCLAEIITPVILGNQFKLADLKPLILHLVECKKAAVLLAEILTIIAKESSSANAKLFCTNSNISCSDVLAKDMPHREFLQQKNLTFLPSDIDEISKLLHQEVIVNDTVNACIDRATAVEDMNSLEPLSAFSPGGCGTTGGWGNSGSAFHEQKVVASRSSAGARTGDKGQVRSDCHSAVEALKFSTKPQMKTEVVQSTYNVQKKVETTVTKEIRDKIRPSLTTEEMTKKTKAIIDMFVNIEDVEEALSCFTDLKSPEIHHVFVSTAVEHTYEFDSKARQLTGRLFNELLLQRKLAKEQFSLGLKNALEFAEDSVIDYPKLWCYLAEIITPVIVGEQFLLADLKPLIMHLVQCNKAAVLLTEILTIIAKESSSANAKLFWTNSNISCSDVLAKDMPHHEFLEQKNLTFLPSDIDEINKLLHQEVIVNDTVNACIDRATAVEDMNSLEPLSAFSPGGCGTTGGWGNSGSAFHEQKVVASRSSAGARTGDKGQVRSDCHSAVEVVKFSTKPAQMKTEVVQSTYNVQEKVESTMTKEIRDKIRPSLTTEEMTKKTKAIIDMFVNIEDMGAALSCFTYFKSPEIHHVFVSTAVEHTYEFDSTARQLTGRLFNELLLQRKLAKEQFSLGLGKALKFAEDSAINYTKLWCCLAEIITPVILGNQFKLADLKPLILHLVECKKAAVLLAEILTIIAKESSSANAKLFCTNSNISCSDVLAKDMPHREFLQQKNLTFLPSDIDEISKLLHQEVIVNDTVNACIDRATAVEDMNSLEPLSAFSPGGCGTTGGWGNSGSAFHEQKVVASRSSAGARTGDKGQVRSDCHSAVEALKFSTKPQMKTEVVQSTYNVQKKVETTVTKEIRDKIRPSLTTEEMTKKTKAIIDMFVNIEDVEEALSCFTDLKSPEIHHVFVSTAVEHTYEFDSKARQLTGRLFNELLLQRKLAKEQFSLGLKNALEFAEDSVIDYPKLWCYLAEIITPVIVGEQFLLADLKPLIMHLVQCNKAAVLLTEILTIIGKEKGPDEAKLLWTASDISWSDVLAEDILTHEFLQQKSLTFLRSEIDELIELLRDELVANDNVFAFIEKHFKEETRKEPEFLSQLASAVAKSCLINKDEKDGPDCCAKRLNARKNILHKYLDNNHGLELEILFALQTLYVQHNKPGRMLLTFFNTFYDEMVITEDSFITWRNDNNPSRQEGKGEALQATTSFFEWLQSAAEEHPES